MGKIILLNETISLFSLCLSHSLFPALPLSTLPLLSLTRCLSLSVLY